MCGIAGIIDTTVTNQNISFVGDMVSKFQHRGPDFQNTIHDNDLATLGHARLSIIDLSSASNQPMYSFDGRYILVFNGQIYNFKELKKELKFYPFKTNSDTEVIIASYIKWGKNCSNKLNGMFSFAIWDKQEQELFCSRDRVGIKPFYYYTANNKFIFSSEIRSLISCPHIKTKVDSVGLSEFLETQTVAFPNTILENIYMLEPGTTLLFSKGKIIKKAYWQAPNFYGKHQVSYETATVEIRDLFMKSVEKQMIADVPLGAFLSGGIDSSAVVAAMSSISFNKVKTFSVNFNESTFSEKPYSDLISKKYDTDHSEINITAKDILRYLPEAIESIDHPTGDGINTYVISKATKEKGITVALTGLGGDELFAGYNTFNRMNLIRKNKWIEFLLKNKFFFVSNLIESLKEGPFSQKTKELVNLDDFNFSSVYGVMRKVLVKDVVNNLLSDGHYDKKSNSNLIDNTNIFNFRNSKDFLSRVSAAEMNTYMCNILLRDSDQMSMASSLELRVPFLDHELIEYTLGLDDSNKDLKNSKKLFVDAMGNLLPPEIVNRPKMGFLFPWEAWLKNDMKSFVKFHIENLSKRPEFNSDYLSSYLKDYFRGDKGITWSRIWHLVILDHWLTQNSL